MNSFSNLDETYSSSRYNTVDLRALVQGVFIIHQPLPMTWLGSGGQRLFVIMMTLNLSEYLLFTLHNSNCSYFIHIRLQSLSCLAES